MIDDVVCFTSELEVRLLADRHLLQSRHVPLVDSVLPKVSERCRECPDVILKLFGCFCVERRCVERCRIRLAVIEYDFVPEIYVVARAGGTSVNPGNWRARLILVNR